MKLYIKYCPGEFFQVDARLIIADKNFKEFRLLEKDEKVLEVKEHNRQEIYSAFSKDELINMLISFNK
jgi:hypothetical protein